MKRREFPLSPPEIHASDMGGGERGNGRSCQFATWPNNLVFTFSGDRIGGVLENVEAGVGGEDILYSTGKASLTAAVVRPAIETGDADLMRVGRDLTEYTIDLVYDGSPLGKLQGEYFSRTRSAVALLAALEPVAALPNGDANGDGAISVTDIFYLINQSENSVGTTELVCHIRAEARWRGHDRKPRWPPRAHCVTVDGPARRQARYDGDSTA